MAALLGGILIAQNFGAARQQVEDVSSALSVPVTDLKIALVIGEQPPVAESAAAAPAIVKPLLASLRNSARQDRSLADALRFLLLARFYGEDPGSTLALATTLARDSKRALNTRIVETLGKETGAWSAGEAREILGAGLGPAAQLAAGSALYRQGRTDEAEQCWQQLRDSGMTARIKMLASSAALLLVMLGGATAWTLYSVMRRGTRVPGVRFGAGAPGYCATMWQTFLIYLVVFLALTAAVAAAAAAAGAAAAGGAKPPRESQIELVHYVVTAAAAFCIAPLFLRMRGRSMRDLGWTSSDWVVDVGWGIGGFLAATALVVVLQMLTGVVLGALGSEPSQVTSPAADYLVGARFGWKLAFLLVVVGIVAPLLEETFFRGALLRAAGCEWGPAAGVFVSALAFAAIHPGIPELLAPYLAIGYVLGKLAVIRQSLLPCVIAHSLNNLFFVGMVLLLQL